jgi:hypothetical protein
MRVYVLVCMNARVRVCVYGAPLFHIRSYYENADSGPFMTQPLPYRPPVAAENYQSFLGQRGMWGTESIE